MMKSTLEKRLDTSVNATVRRLPPPLAPDYFQLKLTTGTSAVFIIRTRTGTCLVGVYPTTAVRPSFFAARRVYSARECRLHPASPARQLSASMSDDSAILLVGAMPEVVTCCCLCGLLVTFVVGWINLAWSGSFDYADSIFGGLDVWTNTSCNVTAPARIVSSMLHWCEDPKRRKHDTAPVPVSQELRDNCAGDISINAPAGKGVSTLAGRRIELPVTYLNQEAATLYFPARTLCGSSGCTFAWAYTNTTFVDQAQRTVAGAGVGTHVSCWYDPAIPLNVAVTNPTGVRQRQREEVLRWERHYAAVSIACLSISMGCPCLVCFFLWRKHIKANVCTKAENLKSKAASSCSVAVSYVKGTSQLLKGKGKTHPPRAEMTALSQNSEGPL